MPEPHHSIFRRPDALPDAKLIVSKALKTCIQSALNCLYDIFIKTDPESQVGVGAMQQKGAFM